MEIAAPATLANGNAERLVGPSIVIMTVDRAPSYIHQTLASLYMSDPMVREVPVHLMIGSQDSMYLSDCAHHRSVQVHPLDAKEWALIEPWWPHRRHAHNYVRCLRTQLQETCGLCICEDDIVFCDEFLSRLRRAIQEMEQRQQSKPYILAAYAAYDFQPDTGARDGQICCRYEADAFYGCQCVYYPARVLELIAAEVESRAVVDPQAPTDMVIKDIGRRLNCIFAIRYSLAQHIGRVTTGLGFFHQSPTFTKLQQ